MNNLVQELATRLQCIKHADDHPIYKGSQGVHKAVVKRIMSTAPSGSGFDAGTKIHKEVYGKGTRKYDLLALQFLAEFHHMDDIGYYCGWTKHIVTVRSALSGELHIAISGPNKRQIKDYIHDVYYSWLTSSFDPELSI